MGRPKQKVQSGFVLFDVYYEDGTRTSNRKVPATELGGLDGDAPARTFVEMQDRMIGEMSGMPRGRIKTIRQVNGLVSIRIVRRECARHRTIESARCGQCMGDPPKNTTVL